MPPSKKPSASVNPGMTELATQATTSEVTITIRKAKLPIMRRQRHNSFQDVYQAASYRSGGRKMTKIISGWMLISGMPGIMLNTSPPSTSTMG
jgi:hypothetical protein